MTTQEHTKKQKRTQKSKHQTNENNEEQTYDKLLSILEVIFAKEMLESGKNGKFERQAKDLRNALLQPPPPVHPLLPKYMNVQQSLPQIITQNVPQIAQSLPQNVPQIAQILPQYVPQQAQIWPQAAQILPQNVPQPATILTQTAQMLPQNIPKQAPILSQAAQNVAQQAQIVPQNQNIVPFVPTPRSFPQQPYPSPQYYYIPNAIQIPKAKLAVYEKDMAQNSRSRNCQKSQLQPSFQPQFQVVNPQINQNSPCTDTVSQTPFNTIASSTLYPKTDLQIQAPYQTNYYGNTIEKNAEETKQIKEVIDNINADIGDTIMVLYRVKSGMVTQKVGTLLNQLPTKVLEPYYVSKVKN